MILVDIAKYLDSKNIGKYSETDGECSIFIEHIPEEGDNVIGLFSSPGEKPDVKTNLERYGMFVIVRGNENPIESSQFAHSVYRALHKAKDVPSENYRILQVIAQDSGFSLWARDENTRYEYSMYFMIIAEEI